MARSRPATTRRLRTPLPRTRRPARRHRAHQLRQPHPPLHPLHLTRLQLPRRPTPAARPLLASGPARSTARPSPDDSPPAEAELYRDWIDNDRRLRRVINQMRVIAGKAAELRLTQARQPPPQV